MGEGEGEGEGDCGVPVEHRVPVFLRERGEEWEEWRSFPCAARYHHVH